MTQSATSTRLGGYICPIADVSDVERDQMHSLMTRFYANVPRDQFEADFDAKTWVIIAKCPSSGIVLGFSTQWFGDYSMNETSFGLLYSGDTIVDPAYWAKNPLATLWGRLALWLIDQDPERVLYWFLISKGYKTYRFLPVFFDQFYPRPDIHTPPGYRLIMDHVARTKFGDRYQAKHGIIRSSRGGCRLRDEVAAVTSQRLRDPFVRFFHSVNPGHARGDELCCLTPLTRNNFNRSAYRVIAAPIDPLGSTSVIDSDDRES